MEFEEFLKKYQSLPILTSPVILAGEPQPASQRVQLARWVKAGYLFQLRRGVYVFAPHFQKVTPTPYFLASTLVSPSYVSLEKAMEFYGLIPEAVFTVTSVTTKRPIYYETPLGRFDYRHLHPRLFWGYTAVVTEEQTGFMAHPEKALLDLFYLQTPHIDNDYLDELRLQHLEKINAQRLLEYARRFEKPGILRAAQLVVRYQDKILRTEKTL